MTASDLENQIAEYNQQLAAKANDPILDGLRRQHPDATDGILFCVYKLQQDPNLTLKDFRSEASLRGITIGGRSLHSAKVLLGLEKPAIRRRRKEIEAEEAEEEVVAPAPVHTPRRGTKLPSDSRSLESSLLQAVRQIQEEAEAKAERLRTAIEQAVSILQEALED